MYKVKTIQDNIVFIKKIKKSFIETLSSSYIKKLLQKNYLRIIVYNVTT